jgi:hypothetical protein
VCLGCQTLRQTPNAGKKKNFQPISGLKTGRIKMEILRKTGIAFLYRDKAE